MNKMNAEGLNEVAISLAALKQSAEGDEVVVLTADNQVGWFRVERVVTQRGCKGGTTLTLVDLTSGDSTTIALRTELPEGVTRVRRVSAGVNARTTRKLAAIAPAPKPVVIQPEGEFENILDVPLPEDAEMEAVADTDPVSNLPETIPAPADESSEPGELETVEALAVLEPISAVAVAEEVVSEVSVACETDTAANG